MSRWSHLKANAKRPEIGTLVNDAMRAIEKDNESLKGVLSKDYADPKMGLTTRKNAPGGLIRKANVTVAKKNYLTDIKIGLGHTI